MVERSQDACLLLVDDDPVFCQDMVNVLGSRYELKLLPDGQQATEVVEAESPDLVLLDYDFGPGRPDGIAILKRLRQLESAPPVIMLTGSADLGIVVDSIKAGAFHYCTKPPRAAELEHLIELGLQENDLRRQMRALQDEVHRIHGDFVVADRRMKIILREIERVAPLDTTVLVTGACGTGKEMIARRVHDLSERSKGPFVGVNCSAIPDTLIESELFGHERGAFTDATRMHRGKFEQAAGGTLFLDEIGDAPPHLHPKLLRVLEERELQRLGGDQLIKVDVRIVAATSKDLESEVAAGRFRPALFYRLNVFRILVPGLDDRPGDVEGLAKHFLGRFAADAKKTIYGFAPEALAYLKGRQWPGNVRELRNMIECGVIRCEGDRIRQSDLVYGGSTVGAAPPGYHEAKNQATHAFKVEYLTTQLRNAAGNITEAARMSGLKRQAFSRMLKDEGIDPEDIDRLATDTTV